MTFREKLAQEKPQLIGDLYEGGCYGCPHDHGYAPENYPSTVGCNEIGNQTRCKECWNREIPETMVAVGEDIPDNPNRKVDTLVKAPGTPEFAKEASKAFRKMSETISKTGDSLVRLGNAASSIKDSGDRTEFATGAVRDMREGKGRCYLMPLEVVAEYFRRGIFEPDPKRAEDFYWIIQNISDFKNSNYTKTDYLYQALSVFMGRYYDYTPTAFLEVAKHFEEGAKKYGENNWQKGIPAKFYIDSAIRHFLKVARGDDDEPHDRAFVWNLMCCIWEVDYHKEKNEQETRKEGVMGNPNVTYKDAKRFVRGLGRMVKAVDQGLKNFGRRLRGAGWNVRRAVESLDLPKV